jgi:hypothetical protein
MNNGKHQKTVQRESWEAWCWRLKIRIVNEKGGVEFVPYSQRMSPKKISQTDESVGER